MLAASDIETSKRLMRAQARKRRDAIPLDDRDRAAKDLSLASRNVLAFGDRIAAYFAVRSELDCLPLATRLQAEGCRLALPIIDDGGPLSFHEWTPGHPVEAGPFGIPHPIGSAALIPSTVFVPLLAFDRLGHRLGYGGGHYDRTLAALRANGAVTAIGIAYDLQEVAEIPAGPYDQRLDYVLTPSGMIPMAEGA